MTEYKTTQVTGKKHKEFSNISNFMLCNYDVLCNYFIPLCNYYVLFNYFMCYVTDMCFMNNTHVSYSFMEITYIMSLHGIHFALFMTIKETIIEQISPVDLVYLCIEFVSYLINSWQTYKIWAGQYNFITANEIPIDFCTINMEYNIWFPNSYSCTFVFKEFRETCQYLAFHQLTFLLKKI